MEIKIVVHVKRVAIAENAAERRQLNGPLRVLPNQSTKKRVGIRQLPEGCWSLAKRD